MSVKVTVNLPEELVGALKEYADARGITMTEALRRAITHENYFAGEIEAGGTVLIEKPDKSIREVVLP
jgi:predicted transcriptional regulator